MLYNVSDDPTVGILWLQWIAGMAAMMSLFVTGLLRGWSSPYLALLVSEDSPLPITTDEASWVASLISLGLFVGTIFGAGSIYLHSSKKTLLAAGIPFALSWVMIIVADSAVWLYLSRFTSGLGIGMVYSSFPLYLGEVASPEIRGSLVTLALSGTNLGMLCGTIMGTYVSMATFAYLSLVPTVIFILVFFCLPESSHDLTRFNKMEEAKKSLQRYNPSIDIERELILVQEFVDASHSITFWERLREFNLPQNRMAGLIIVLLFVFLQFSGINTVLFYTETILSSAMLTVIEPAMMVIISNVVGTAAALLATYPADKFGRKKLLIGSSAGICVTMIGLGVHFTLIDNGFDPNKLQWLPIASLIGYQLSLCFGHAIIPNMVLSELFAPHIKSMAACLAGITGGAAAFLSSKTYQPLVDTFGGASIFWLHAVSMALCVVFVLTLMPETQCKSLQEIQDKLQRKQLSK